MRKVSSFKQVADEVFEVTGKNPMLDIALELERIAPEDDLAAAMP
jgi:citrate synthase